MIMTMMIVNRGDDMSCYQRLTSLQSLFTLVSRITLGNQLDGVHLLDPEVIARFKKRYPDGNPMKAKSS